MSSDGFGDQLSSYESWLHVRAHQMVPGTRLLPNGGDHDDLKQLGLIAMWKALESFDPAKGALPAWLTMKATGAMKDDLRPRAKHISQSSLDLEDFTPEALIEHPDLLENIICAYYAGEVAQAIDVLTPKQQEYVRLRFWKGYRTTQLKAHFGYDPSGLWNSKKNGAKYKLQKALAHLE